MRAKVWRALAIVAILLAAVVVSALLVLHTTWARNRTLTWAITLLDARYHLVLSARSLTYNALTLHVAVDDVRLAARGHESAPFFTAKRVEVGLPRSVYSGRFSIDWLRITDGATEIVRDEAGVSNLPPSSGGPTPLTPRRVNIRAIAFDVFNVRYVDRLRDLDLVVPAMAADLVPAKADLKPGPGGATGPFSIRGQTTFRRHEQTITLEPAEAQLTFDGSTVTFESLPFSSPDLGGTLKGQVRRVLDSTELDLSVEGVAHLDDAIRWVTSPVPVSGSANVRGTLTGAPSKVLIALDVVGTDLTVGRETGLRVEGPVRITPDVASSENITLTPATGGSIRASFNVPFTNAGTLTRAQFSGLDLQSAFRLSNLDPPPLGFALDGELTFETGTTRKLVFTNRGTARASSGLLGISGTAKGSLVGNNYSVEQSHQLPGFTVEGRLSGVVNTTRAIQSTVAGTPHVHIDNVGTAADSLATLGVTVPAFARRIGGVIDAPVVELSGTYDEPIVHTRVNGDAVDVPSLGLAGVRATIDADSHQVTLADVEAIHGSARVTGELVADLDTRSWSGALRAKADEAADLQSAAPESWRISGPLQADATVSGPLDAIQFDTKVTGSGLALGGQPITELAATAVVTPSSIDLTALDLKGEAGHIAGRVQYNWDSGTYTANLDGSDLTYRASLLAEDDTLAKASLHFEGAGATDDLAGTGTAKFSISGGTAGTLVGDGDLSFELLHDRVRFLTQLPSLNARITGTIEADAPYAYHAEAELNRVPLAPLAAIANAREGQVDGFLTMTANVGGAIESENGQTATVLLQAIEANVGDVPIKLANPTTLGWRQHSLTVDPFELGVGKGKLAAAGTWTANQSNQQFEGSYTGTVEDATGIAHAFNLPTTLDGTGNLTTTFKWNGDPSRASGTLTLREGSIATFHGPAPVTGLEVDAKLEGETLTVSRVAGRVASGEVDGGFSLHASAKVPDLKVDQAVGEIALDEAALTISGLPVHPERPSRVTFNKGVFTAADVAWNVADSRVVITGTTTVTSGAETALDLGVKGQSDLRILTAFFPTLGFDGTGDIDARVTGTVSAPLLNGNVTLADAEVAISDPRLVISDVSGPVALSGDTIVIENLRGSANGGTLLMDGRLKISGTELSGGTLNVQAQGVAMEFPRGLRTEVNALLTFRPETRAPTLTGDVRVLQGSYTESITLAGLATRGGSAAPALGITDEPTYLDSIRLNVSVTTDEDIVMDNNYGRLEAGASFPVTGTVAEPGMDGRVTLREGGELFLAGRTFRITRGDISFTDLRRIEPQFDIAAEAHVGARDVTMSLTGSVERPSLELSTPDGGESTGDLASEIVGGGNAESALTLLSADLLGVTGRAIGLDALRVERGDQFDTDFREDPSLIADTTDPAARLTIAKRLSDEVEFTVSQNLRESGKTTFVVSYFPVSNFELRGISRDNSTLVFGIRHRVTIGGGRSITERPKPPLITAVNLPLEDPIVQATATRSIIRVKAGDRFDFLELQRDVDRLREALHAQGYFEARVRTRRTESEDCQSVTIDYNVDRGPHTTVEVRGVELSAKELKDLEEAWVKGIIFDRFLVDDLTLHVQRDLVLRGELNSIVLGTVTRDAQGNKHVRLDVTPGIPVSGRQLRFEGNSNVSSKLLEEAIKAARIDLEPWFDPKVLERPLRVFYSQQGYLRAEVTAGPLIVDGSEAVLPVRIVEGPQARITAFDWTGVAAEHEYILNGSHGLQPPQAFLTSAVNDARRRVERAYRIEGFNSAEVEVSPRITSDESVELTFDVIEGSQQVLQDVSITGNARTRDNVISEALHFEIGKPVNQDEWALARKRLYDTNVFRQVTLETSPVGQMVNGQQPVRANVGVQEYPPWTVRYGFQLEGDREEELQDFARKENFGVVGEVKNPNLFGRALTLGVSGQYQWDQREATMFLATSRLFGWRARSSLFGSLESLRLRDDEQNIVALSHLSRVTAEQRWKRRTTQLVYGYRLERNRTFDPDPAPLDPFPLDTTTFNAKITSALLWDRRDDPLNATEGWFASASWDVSREWLGSDLENTKLLMQEYDFLPLSDRFVFASRAQVGLAYGRDDLLETDSFRAGGATTVRGYAEGALGPRGLLGLPSGGDALFILNGEMRMPLYRWVRGVAFIDAGNIFGNDEPVRLRDLKLGYGFGLRLDTPVGLFRVDFGIPASALNGVASSREPNSLKGGRWYVGLGHIF